MSSTIKKVARRLLGERTLGMVDYYRFPERRLAWGPFNGQEGRRAIFELILSTTRPALILETGTFRGTTAELLAQTGLPVVTIEDKERNYGFSRARLRRFSNIDLRLGDSRIETRRTLQSYRQIVGNQPIFAYLDAHCWRGSSPLAEELDIVFSLCPQAVVMVDDFLVPGDPGYGYDTYGPGETLDQDYVEPAMTVHRLAAFYPTLPSSEETGDRRGFVILANEAMWSKLLLSTGYLRCT